MVVTSDSSSSSETYLPFSSLSSSIWRLALPLMGSLAMEPAMSLFDTFYVANFLGPHCLSALGLADRVVCAACYIVSFVLSTPTTPLGKRGTRHSQSRHSPISSVAPQGDQTHPHHQAVRRDTPRSTYQESRARNPHATTYTEAQAYLSSCTTNRSRPTISCLTPFLRCVSVCCPQWLDCGGRGGRRWPMLSSVGYVWGQRWLVWASSPCSITPVSLLWGCWGRVR